MRIPKTWSFAVIVIFIVILCVGCKSQPNTPQTAEATLHPAAASYTLDVVILSPITIVQYKSGEIEALLPYVDKHTYAYLKGLNDCAMDEGKGVDYRLDFSTSNATTTIDPNNNIPDEVRIDNNHEPVNVDPQKRRFNKIWLPKPKEIVPIHLDDEGLSIYVPSTTLPRGHLYPTQVALRYAVDLDTKMSLSSTTYPQLPVCPLKVEHMDKEMIVTMGMGPAVEDDDIHSHAKAAFYAERDFLPPLKREIDYPKLAKPPKRTNRRHRASDCQAPIILVTNADQTKK